MVKNKYSPSFYKNQLALPGFSTWTPGYPARGVMRVLVYCHLYGWPSLGALAELQLSKILDQGGAL